jgi:hypothetical protein
VYDSERYGGHFSYTIPNLTPGGSYDVQMQFAENYWTSAGKRVFNVAINGVSALSSYDIFATAGGAHKAVQEDFVTVADANGTITLSFASTRDNAQINGFRIIALAAGPTDLAATAVSSSEIDLAWTGVSGGVIGYNVYRGTSSGGESLTPLNATPLTDTVFQDTTALPSTTYYYIVKAITDTGLSAASNEASATTGGGMSPDVPPSGGRRADGIPAESSSPVNGPTAGPAGMWELPDPWFLARFEQKRREPRDTFESP